MVGSFLASLILVVLMSLSGFDPAKADLGYWLEHIDNVMSGFASLLLICIAVLTAGGSWSRWMIPLAVAFGLRMLGNVYYSLTADTYAYGSLADWLWLFGSTAAYMFLIQGEEATSEPASVG